MHIINLCPSVTSVCPFLSHTEITELTDIISLDVNVFRVFRCFRVPYSDPLIICVHPCRLCDI